MRIFALDTDVDGLKRRFLTDGEREVMMSYYHGMSFFIALVGQVIFTLAFVAIGTGALLSGVDVGSSLSILAVLWFVWVFTHIIKAYLDWCQDFFVITTDNLVLVDQTSFFKRRITPITLDNFASVAAESQLFDIFSFGKVIFNLKEGVGGEMTLKYVPNYKEVAAALADCVTKFQRRRAQQFSAV